jgi:hypothetical protein
MRLDAIGCDNIVVLNVEWGTSNAVIQVRNFYPTEFPISAFTLSINLPANNT